MSDTHEKADEKAFNETLKRMLKTPPKAHDSDKAEMSQDKKERAKPAKASLSPSSSSKP
ncbi:hypothetical protein [Mesorhizobium escarrei]|uniref:Uncharacterized protein n=1 Tax=Mesorhizobium escarrei TaxID=666018 RepID=A0ABN8KKU1_9HYPH|nr:hypothetical protein [Mesorhizobium escarrei]CAH2409365.1 hypothetical protein MES5069_830012 [Mesorhizobium escarrei]